MFVKLLLLVLLPALSYSFIEVKITPIEEAAFEFSGTSVSPMSDTAKEAFKIDDKAFLKVSKEIMGAQCSDIFFSSSTPWGDVYQKFGWQEVQLQVVPIKGEVQSISYTDREIVDSAKYENRKSTPKNFPVKLSHDVTLTASHSWSSIEVQSKEDIHYVLDLDLDNLWSYTSSFGQNSSNARKSTIGNTKNMNVTVEPNSAKVAQMSAHKVTMLGTIEYEAQLIGDVFCNYEEKYKNHHFYRIDISDFQEILNTPMTLKFTETIELHFFGDILYNINDEIKSA